jgi:adenylosuccinate synthase
LDGLEEKLRGGKAIGTTSRGIGPAFADKTARHGIRIGDVVDQKNFKEQLRVVLEYKNLLLTKIFGVEPLSLEKMYKEYLEYGKYLKPYVRDTTVMLAKALKQGKTILLEGAQGTMLDPDFGTYPFVTSSSPTSAGASIGSGVGINKITRALGVFKAYTSRVGAGPMPTELLNKTGETIRELGHEYGTTTGRPRRIGWFDGVAARFSNRVNGFTGMAITRFDILDTLPSIKICTAYKIGDKCGPVYEEWEGWQTVTCGIRKFKDLPPAAQAYVKRLEKLVGCPANLICVGPERTQTIHKSAVL